MKKKNQIDQLAKKVLKQQTFNIRESDWLAANQLLKQHHATKNTRRILFFISLGIILFLGTVLFFTSKPNRNHTLQSHSKGTLTKWILPDGKQINNPDDWQISKSSTIGLKDENPEKNELISTVAEAKMGAKANKNHKPLSYPVNSNSSTQSQRNFDEKLVVGKEVENIFFGQNSFLSSVSASEIQSTKQGYESIFGHGLPLPGLKRNLQQASVDVVFKAGPSASGSKKNGNGIKSAFGFSARHTIPVRGKWHITPELGLQVFNGFGYQDESIARQYSFGSTSLHITSRVQSALYAFTGLRAGYTVNNRISAGIGLGINWLLNTRSEITEETSQSGLPLVVKSRIELGYKDGFTRVNMHYNAGIHYRINALFGLGLEGQFGLTDLVDDTFFATKQSDKERLLLITLSYRIK